MLFDMLSGVNSEGAHMWNSFLKTVVLRIGHEKLFKFDLLSGMIWYEVCLADNGGRKKWLNV
jgi:hypothetical protein